MAQMPAGVDLGETVGWSPPLEAPTLAEFASATWDDTRKVQNLDAHLFNYSNAFDSIADRVKAATGEALDNPFRSASAGQSVEMLGAFSREAVEGSSLYAQWRRNLEALRAKHPDKLDWDSLLEEPGRVAWESMKKAREESDALSERIGMVSPKDVPLVGGIPVVNSVAALGANLARHPLYTAAQLAASFAGQMTSPADAVVNLISFGVGGAAKSIIKNATMNALANASGQALLSAPKQLSYQSAGLPYGARVWAEEVGAAAGAGFALDAAIRTPARGAIRRFGADTPAGTAFSRNTERGGILFDAIEDATPTARPRLDLDPETISKAEAGDIAASREVLEKTGAMEDPAVKYAVEHMEAGGRLTDDVLDMLEKQLGVARPDGMRALADAMQGRMPDALPEPVRQAAEPLAPDQGAAVLDRMEAVSGAMERLPPQIRQAVQDGLDAGIPKIVRAVQKVLDDTPERIPERIIETVAPLLDERTIAEARLHSGQAGPVEIARAIRQFPDLIDSNTPLEARQVAMGRSIARLDDVAFADVMRGDVPGEVAAMVSDRVPRPDQARVLSDLQKAQPKSVAEAAGLIDSLTPPQKPAGTAEPLAPGAKIDDPSGPAAKARTESLRQEAGQPYADVMAPIERRTAIEDELKKLRGQLIKGKREEAPQTAEGGEGEASGPGDIRKQIEALEREHAVLQAKIMPGPEGYELARLATRAIDLRREADVTAAVNDALRLGAAITPEGTRIDVRPDEDMVFRAANGTLAQIDATSDMATGHIQLAVSALDPMAKIGHEAVHTLVTLGHLSPAEVDALSSLAREAGTFTKDADYRKAYEGRDGLDRIIAEEAAGSYIEARIKGDVDGPANTVVERIRQLLERIRRALKGYGFQSREDVVQAIMSGDAARREARADWRRDAVIQGKSEMKAAAERGTTLPDGTEIKGVPLFAIRAFHGSPHDFDRFSLDKIGTGEGAQAFGYGLYFAESEGVARSYRDVLATKGQAAAATLTDRLMAEKPPLLPGEKWSEEDQKQLALSRLDRMETEGRAGDWEYLAPIYRQTREYITSGKPIGHLYEVRIDAEPDDFLDWDRPLSEQSKKVRAAAKELGRGETGRDVVRAFEDGQRNLGYGDGREEMARRLREAGIKGIRYLDAGSRNAGDGSRNFVVFDDSLIEITHKDGEPVAPSDQLFALRDWIGRPTRRRPLGAYRAEDVLTSDDLPGRFTWKSPPKQGKVQMFHATDRSFDRFDPTKSQDFGIHFGTQKQAWNRVLQTDRIEGSRVIPANVEFNNSITLHDPGFWGPHEMFVLLRDKGVRFSREEEAYFRQLGKDIDRAAEMGPVAKGALRWIVNEAKDAIKEKLDDAGIDAIWYRNNAEGAGWSLMVWNEGQVRNTITGDLLYSMPDEPPIKSDMAFVDRMNRMGELIAVCRG